MERPITLILCLVTLIHFHNVAEAKDIFKKNKGKSTFDAIELLRNKFHVDDKLRKPEKLEHFPYRAAYLDTGDIKHLTFAVGREDWNRSTGKYEDAAVHMWVRCVCRWDPVAKLAWLNMRGFLYAQKHEQNSHKLLPLRQPIPQWWRPNVQLITGRKPEQRLNVSTVVPTIQTESPISWEAYDIQAEEPEVHLTVDAWPQYHSLSVAECCSRPYVDVPQGDRKKWEVVVVLNKLFNLRKLFAADLLATHIHYHRCLGITRYVLFATKAQAARLHSVPAIRHLVEAGVLSYLEPAGMPAMARYPYAWQPILYNYALLHFWRNPIWLFFIDADEYLAMGRGWDIPLLLNTTSPCVHLYLVNYHPDDKQREREGASSLTVAEYLLGQTRKAQKPVHYQPKGMVFPDRVHSYHVHMGMCPEKEILDWSAAHLAHYPNLYKMRWVSAPNGTVTEVELPFGDAWVVHRCFPRQHFLKGQIQEGGQLGQG